MKNPLLKEHHIQRAIVGLLRAHGALVIQNRSSQRIAHLMDQQAKGSPDIIALLPGAVVLFIEVKRPGGRLSAAQREWHARALRNGNEVMVVDDVRTVERWLEVEETP